MSERQRCISAVRKAQIALAEGQAQHAAWFGLWATEINPQSGLAWALVARVLYDTTADALATVVMRWALTAPALENWKTQDRKSFERFHRVDLWSRGLLQHSSGAHQLSLGQFDEEEGFQKTELYEAWFQEREERWPPESCARVLARLVGALSDAYEMPSSDDPLRSNEVWQPLPGFEAWKGEQSLEVPLAEVPQSKPDSVAFSDYWAEERVTLLEQEGELSRALEVTSAWIEMRPERLKPRVERIRLLLLHGKEDEAEAEEKALLELETEDLFELDEARVGLSLAGRFSALLQVLQRMNELAPGNAALLAQLGAAELEMNQPEASEAHLRLALELEPSHGPALTSLGLLRLREDDLVAARAMLEEAKNLHPDEPEVRYFFAMCLHRQAAREQAKLEAEAALQLDPGFVAAQELLEEIEAKNG